jgi:hypothetical protein
MNGHTSGLRLFGSDETNTGRRERRRRMRADRDVHAHWLRKTCDSDRIDQRNGDKRDRLLLICVTAFGERRRHWHRAFLRGRTTGLVRAAVRFATIRAHRIRENAGSGGQLERPHQHRQHDGNQDWCCPPHDEHFITKDASRRPHLIRVSSPRGECRDSLVLNQRSEARSNQNASVDDSSLLALCRRYYCASSV